MLKMTSKMKRFWSLALTMIMVLSMGLVVSAATMDKNMTNSSTQWTVKVKPGESVRLYASPAGSDWSATGFTKPEEGQATSNVSWTSTNSSIAAVVSTGFEDAPTSIAGLAGLYCAYADVEVPADTTIGSCSIAATNTEVNPNSTVNFTVVVDSSVEENASNIIVRLPNLDGELSLEMVCHTTMNFATPLDALKQLKADPDNGFTYETQYSDTYITSMTYLNKTETTKTVGDITYGWNYRVYRNDMRVDDSAVMSSDAFQLQNNDVVIWYYGSPAEAEKYFTITIPVE